MEGEIVAAGLCVVEASCCLCRSQFYHLIWAVQGDVVYAEVFVVVPRLRLFKPRREKGSFIEVSAGNGWLIEVIPVTE